jgi:hypothetical protein
MANTLFNASAAPAEIGSKGTTTITVTCEVSDGGPMTIGSSNGYTITTNERILKAGQLSDTFSETITGPVGDCWLTLVFRGSSTDTVVTITK